MYYKNVCITTFIYFYSEHALLIKYIINKNMTNKDDIIDSINKALSSFFAPVQECKDFTIHSRNINLRKSLTRIPIKYTKPILSHKKIHIYYNSNYITHCISLSNSVYIIAISNNTLYYYNVLLLSPIKLINNPLNKEE